MGGMMMIFDERTLQGGANGLLMISFIVVAILQARLWLRLRSKRQVTPLGAAMETKYLAWAIASGLLAILQAYSLYFNITGEVGIFTFPVRNTLRYIAVLGMLAAAAKMYRMDRELGKAEQSLVSMHKKEARNGTQGI